LPQEGELYEIKEKDALEEIYEKARNVNSNMLKQEMIRKAEESLNVNYSFQKACKSRKFTYLPLYTLSFDIKDEKGRVIYPKGYTFNPLDYMPSVISSYRIVFFNGKSEVEKKWLLGQKDLVERGILIAVKGNIRELVYFFKRPIYAFNDEMKERFKIEKTPSIVSFEGNKVVVEEVGIYKCK